MIRDLSEAISRACRDLFGADAAPELTRPEERFGDYATNVALRLAGQTGKDPRDIAGQLAYSLRGTLAGDVAEVSVAGPGFLNLKLTDEALLKAAEARPGRTYEGQEILVEFGDPNPFKEMHIGHLYSYVVGDAICRLFETAGARVRRLSYHGDVGLHVAKALWAMRQDSEGDIGALYAQGAKAYETDEAAKQQIDELNARIYDQDSEIQELYRQGRERSFADFDAILRELGISNDRRYLESQSAAIGTDMVRQNVGKVFAESQGAIVYEGEKAGLHTRVFITGRGLPTYEAKDLGLTRLKDQDYPEAALSVIITAHEQAEYFKVMLAALREINPEVAAKTRHLSHGFVNLSTGKMSSRTGDVYSASDLLESVRAAARQAFADTNREIQLGATKYAFLKNRLGGDIVYDPAESVSLEGNSGPYLQYAHARAQSILRKADAAASAQIADELEADERSLLRKLGEYSETVDKAVAELMPHHVCTYLYELAQAFNRFYEKNRVVGDSRQATRLGLVSMYADSLKQGLELLGIAAPDKM